MEKEAAERVEIVGADNKRQITALFTVSMAGDFLPVQLIYQGKTSKCLPPCVFPLDWHVVYSANRWSNDTTMQGYVDKILLPCIQKKREELQLESDYPTLAIFDVLKGQCTEMMLKIIMLQLFLFLY